MINTIIVAIRGLKSKFGMLRSKRMASSAAAILLLLQPCTLFAQELPHYQPTLESLDRHPLPQWFSDAKLGIFVVWGIYSVPGWAPLQHPSHDFTSQDYINNNPYAEWYYNSMRIPGSPTQAYHREHYGAGYNYYDFTKVFDQQIKKWNPDEWAQIFRDTGAQYIVLTAKFHDGFALWPSKIVNPTLPPDRQHATRDIVGELTKAVRKKNMRMGIYYSGGYDWTFLPGPITKKEDYKTVKPQSAAYGAYADAQIRELTAWYKPSELWNDIDWPKSGKPLEDMAYYYNTVPDGVVDDRFGVAHSDFTTPEYKTLSTVSVKKWEECRGLGASFGYNRAEGEAQTIAPDQLIYLLVDIVSKNGNLLLDVGPEADGTIPAVQMERLRALGKWLSQNAEAIYGTRPWVRAEGMAAEGIPVRFTTRGGDLFAILLGNPSTKSIAIKDLHAMPGSEISMLGADKPLPWSQDGQDLKISLPPSLPGDYAYVLRISVSK